MEKNQRSKTWRYLNKEEQFICDFYFSETSNLVCIYNTHLFSLSCICRFCWRLTFGLHVKSKWRITCTSIAVRRSIHRSCRGKFCSSGRLPAGVDACPRCPASLLFTGVKTPPGTNRTSTAENASHVKGVVSLSSCALSVQLLWVVYHLEAPQALIQALYLLLKCLCFMLWVQCRPGWDKSWRNVASMP